MPEGGLARAAAGGASPKAIVETAKPHRDTAADGHIGPRADLPERCAPAPACKKAPVEDEWLAAHGTEARVVMKPDLRVGFEFGGQDEAADHSNARTVEPAQERV